MRLTLIRHCKVNYKWKVMYNSIEYKKACNEYDNSGVIDNGLRISTEFSVVTSTMHRAFETSRFIFEKEPAFSDHSLSEVPIKPFVSTRLKLPKILWHILGRIQWRLGHKRQPESYQESQRRVNLFIDKLLAQNENCIVVCHGWIIKLIIKKLKRIGFNGPKPLFIKAGVPYEFVRQQTNSI